MTINGRIWSSYAVVLGTLGVACYLGYTKARDAQGQSRQLVEEHFEELDAAKSCLVALTEAQLQQRQFELKRDTNAAAQVRVTMQQVSKELKRIAAVSTESGNLDSLDKTAGLVTKYLTAFSRLVDLKIRRGLTPRLGLEGELRKAVQEVEAKVKDQSSRSISLRELLAV